MKVQANERLIIALDNASVAEAQAMVDKLDGIVRFYKVGLVMQLAQGTSEFVRSLIAGGRKGLQVLRRAGDYPQGGGAGCKNRGLAADHPRVEPDYPGGGGSQGRLRSETNDCDRTDEYGFGRHAGDGLFSAHSRRTRSVPGAQGA